MGQIVGFDCSARSGKCHTLHSIAYPLSLYRWYIHISYIRFRRFICSFSKYHRIYQVIFVHILLYRIVILHKYLPEPYLYPTYTLTISYLNPTYTLLIPYLCPTYTLPIPYLYPTYVLPIPYICPTYTLPVP